MDKSYHKLNSKRHQYSRYAAPIIVLAVLSVSTIVPGSSGYASRDPYDSGYDHGCDDARISDSSDIYINQPEKGPSFHTDAFNRGYNEGFSSCSGGGDGGSGEDESNRNVDRSQQSSEGLGSRFCAALNRGDLVAAKGMLAILDYGTISAGARILCGIANLADFLEQ